MHNRSGQTMALSLAVLLTAVLLAACGDSTPTAAPPAGNNTSAAAPVTTSAAATTAGATKSVVTATTGAASSTAAASASTSAPGTTAASSGTAASATTAAAALTAGGNTASSNGASLACDKPVAASTNNKVYKIGISVQAPIPALLNAIEGFKKGMAQCGFTEGKNVKYDIGNALNDIPSLTTIGKKFADDKDDLIVAVGTQALVAMYNTNKDSGIPIVFNSVTDPYTALKGVINSPTDHSFITGIQALAPIEDAMKQIQIVVPNAKNVGLVYNPAETNSKISHDLAVDIANKLGLKIIDAAITGSGDVLPAAQSLADKVDVFFSTTDVTVVNALESLVKVATDSKKPLFANDPDSGSRGAVVALGLDYTDNGTASAGKAALILDGKKPQDVPVEKQKKGFLSVNLKAADQMGVKIPDSILKQADQKFTEIKAKQ